MAMRGRIDGPSTAGLILRHWLVSNARAQRHARTVAAKSDAVRKDLYEVEAQREALRTRCRMLSNLEMAYSDAAAEAAEELREEADARIKKLRTEKDAELRCLRTEITQLKDKTAHSHSQVSATPASARALASAEDTTTSQHDSGVASPASSVCGGWGQELGRVRGELEMLRVSQNDSSDSNAVAASKVQAQEHLKLKEQLQAELRMQLDKATQSAKDTVRNLEQQNEELLESRSKAERERVPQIRELEQTNAQLLVRCEQLERGEEGAPKRLFELQRSNAQLLARCEQLERIEERAREGLFELQQSNAQLLAKCNQLERKDGSAPERLVELQQTNTQLVTKCEELARRSSVYEAQGEALEQQLRSSYASAEKLRAQDKALQEQLQSAFRERDNLLTKEKMLQEQLKGSQQQLRHVRQMQDVPVGSRTQESRDSLFRMQSSNLELRRECESLESRVVRYESSENSVVQEALGMAKEAESMAWNVQNVELRRECESLETCLERFEASVPSDSNTAVRQEAVIMAREAESMAWHDKMEASNLKEQLEAVQANYLVLAQERNEILRDKAQSAEELSQLFDVTSTMEQRVLQVAQLSQNYEASSNASEIALKESNKEKRRLSEALSRAQGELQEARGSITHNDRVALDLEVHLHTKEMLDSKNLQFVELREELHRMRSSASQAEVDRLKLSEMLSQKKEEHEFCAEALSIAEVRFQMAKEASKAEHLNEISAVREAREALLSAEQDFSGIKTVLDRVESVQQHLRGDSSTLRTIVQAREVQEAKLLEECETYKNEISVLSSACQAHGIPSIQIKRGHGNPKVFNYVESMQENLRDESSALRTTARLLEECEEYKDEISGLSSACEARGIPSIQIKKGHSKAYRQGKSPSKDTYRKVATPGSLADRARQNANSWSKKQLGNGSQSARSLHERLYQAAGKIDHPIYGPQGHPLSYTNVSTSPR